MQDFAIFYTQLKWTSLSNVTKSVNHCETTYEFYCMVGDRSGDLGGQSRLLT